MFETTVYADVGSAFTKLWAKGRSICEESRAALDPDDGSRVLAVGGRSRQLLNITEAYPVRGGAAADATLAAIMLRRLTLDMLKRKTLCGVSLTLLLPQGLGGMQKLTACNMARQAGFGRVRTQDALTAGALGAGLDFASHEAVMIADLGRDKLSTAVLANGGSVAQSFSRFGSARFEKTLQAYMASEHGMLIGARTAETVKLSLHMPNIPVCGRSAASGEPTTMLVRSSELRSALSRVYNTLASELISALDGVPPDAAADICGSGILLIGGGALQFGLCSELEARLRLPVRAAQNAMTAAVYGASGMKKTAPRSAVSAKAARLAGLA